MSPDESSDVAAMKQRIVGVFSRAAPTYDSVGPRFFSHFGRRLVDRAGIPIGCRVLDVATGRGAVLLAAAEAVGPHGHVTGSDLSEPMVRQLADEIRRRRLANADVCRMDAEALAFADASFDCVLCGLALFLFPRLDDALSEIRRVLRPGGRLAATTFDKSFDEQWKWFDKLAEEHLPGEPETTQAAESQLPLAALDDPEEIEGVMTRAGFTNVQVVAETAEFVYADEEEFWSSLWSHGMREALEEIQTVRGPQGLDGFKAAVIAKLRSMGQADGVHLSFPALFTLATKSDV
jgi:O-methyltransferase / aklanonic acid methyltransferase